MSERKGMALFAALLMIGLTTCANMAKGEISTAEFKDMLQGRILGVLSTTSTRSFAHPGMMKNDGIRRSGAMIGNGR